jgi:hypothetical protein
LAGSVSTDGPCDAGAHTEQQVDPLQSRQRGCRGTRRRGLALLGASPGTARGGERSCADQWEIVRVSVGNAISCALLSELYQDLPSYVGNPPTDRPTTGSRQNSAFSSTQLRIFGLPCARFPGSEAKQSARRARPTVRRRFSVGSRCEGPTSGACGCRKLGHVADLRTRGRQLDVTGPASRRLASLQMTRLRPKHSTQRCEEGRGRVSSARFALPSDP